MAGVQEDINRNLKIVYADNQKGFENQFVKSNSYFDFSPKSIVNFQN